MAEPALVDNLSDDYLDILGQQPALKIYTQICFCFPVADPSSHSAIISKLTSGLERLSVSFPWVAGKVVNEGSSEGNSGVFKFKPLEKIPRLIVKDLRDVPSMPTMDALRKARFPFRMLDESIISPRKTLAGDSALEVFLLQANFITGGLLLTFNAQHNTMDMTGQGQVIYLISKACRNEQFTREELLSGNLSRRNLIPLFDDSYLPGPELDHQIVKPLIRQSELPPPSKSTWAYFIFRAHSLAALKSLAAKTLTVDYVSTDDALSAFIWQSVTRIRLPRLDASREVTFARAIDVRRHLGISPTYTGLLQNMTYNNFTVQKLVDEPLGVVASSLRSMLNNSDPAYRTRALATVMDRAPEKSGTSFTATLDLSADIMLSSWAKVECHDLDFGFGKPEAVRRPQFDPVESLIYLLPKAADGEITVGICLRDEDMERLRVDSEFMKYGTYIG